MGNSWLALHHFKACTSDKDGVASSPFDSGVRLDAANSCKENIILRLTKTKHRYTTRVSVFRMKQVV